jgi:hypothetical protein
MGKRVGRKAGEKGEKGKLQRVKKEKVKGVERKEGGHENTP